MTKSTDVVHNASEFVSAFLKSHAKDALSAWSANEVQNSYTKLFDALGRKRKSNSQNLPKRGKSSYLFFCQDMRQKVKDKNPSLSSKEITIELGVLWNKIKDDKAAIAKYVTAASKDKERYDQEKERRATSSDSVVESDPSRENAPKSRAKPKPRVKPDPKPEVVAKPKAASEDSKPRPRRVAK